MRKKKTKKTKNKILFEESRVLVNVFSNPLKVSWGGWPYSQGKIVLYDDKLVLTANLEKFELRYSDVDCFRLEPFSMDLVRIIHHSPDVGKFVYVRSAGPFSEYTPSLFAEIKKVVQQNKLNVKIVKPFF